MALKHNYTPSELMRRILINVFEKIKEDENEKKDKQ